MRWFRPGFVHAGWIGEELQMFDMLGHEGEIMSESMYHFQSLLRTTAF